MVHKAKFEDIGPYKGGCVKFDNHIPCLVKHKGTIQLIDKIPCDNVYQVEGHNYKFLSVSHLNRSCYRVEFHNRKTKIHDFDGKIIGTSDQIGGNFFYLDLSNETCLFAKQEDVWLWNNIIFHVNFDNLVNTNKMKKVRGSPKLKKPNNAMCKQYQLRKMTKSGFKSQTYIACDILELVHTDLCGPSDVQSYCGDKYLILFVNDYSRMMTIIFLKAKSSTFQLFKWYLAKVEKGIGNIPNCLRSEKGGEFISNEFNTFFNGKGIKRQVSARTKDPASEWNS